MVIDWKDIISRIKLQKNTVEMQGYRNSHIRNSVSLLSFFSWLEHEVLVENQQINEYEACLELEKLRQKQVLYQGPSFPTIMSAGSNGAIVHYNPSSSSSKIITADEMLLCDSGGHYFDGTTDTTRTFHFGTPTEYEKHCYTLVLKGNLAFERIIFPSKNTPDNFVIKDKSVTVNDSGKYTVKNIDVMARQYLYKYGLNYNHGTSHHVGHFLNVHEGPHNTPLKEGYVITNEPGFYEQGKFGIRIENMLLWQKHTEYDDFLRFENLTMFPYCKKLIDRKLLNNEEIDHINQYYAQLYDTLNPLLTV